VLEHGDLPKGVLRAERRPMRNLRTDAESARMLARIDMPCSC
jgi:hypothetical protein